MRRGWMVWVGLCVLGCGRGEPPFLLLVTVDTLRADRLGAYGSPLGLTPHLDALAGRSEVFDAAYAPASYTFPSVAALLSGRYPEEIGALANRSMLQARISTLAEVLQLYDWRTGAVVSNYVLRRGTGIEAGFEEYDDRVPELEAKRTALKRSAADATDAALAVLDRLSRVPGAGRFLWVHYQDPHGPYVPADERRARYLERERETPGGRRRLPAHPECSKHGCIPAYQYVQGEHEVAFYVAGYDGEVSALDEQIGRLLAGVEARGLLEDAVIVFTADHGESLGEDDYWFQHGEYVSDPLVRVPLMLRVPGRTPARRGDLCSLVDVFPTLLHLAGPTAPGGYRGRDLLAPGAESIAARVYSSNIGSAPVLRYGLAHDGYRILVAHAEAGVEERLYAVGDESRELGAADPERLARMREELSSFRRSLRGGVDERVKPLSPEERERLRGLGYLVD
jgi:arylsulfatase